jgi:hypothetical protein
MGDAWCFPLSTQSPRAVGKRVFARLKRWICVRLGAHSDLSGYRLDLSDDLDHRPPDFISLISALPSPGMTATASPFMLSNQ